MRELRRELRECPVCGHSVAMQTAQIFCSGRCKTRAFAQRKRLKSPKTWHRWMVARVPLLVRHQARCSSCHATVAEQLSPVAFAFTVPGRVLLQRLADGRLVAAGECSCGSFTRLVVDDDSRAVDRLPPLSLRE